MAITIGTGTDKWNNEFSPPELRVGTQFTWVSWVGIAVNFG
jgi:hypothetical protein